MKKLNLLWALIVIFLIVTSNASVIQDVLKLKEKEGPILSLTTSEMEGLVFVDIIPRDNLARISINKITLCASIDVEMEPISLNDIKNTGCFSPGFNSLMIYDSSSPEKIETPYDPIVTSRRVTFRADSKLEKQEPLVYIQIEYTYNNNGIKLRNTDGKETFYSMVRHNYASKKSRNPSQEEKNVILSGEKSDVENGPIGKVMSILDGVAGKVGVFVVLGVLALTVTILIFVKLIKKNRNVEEAYYNLDLESGNPTGTHLTTLRNRKARWSDFAKENGLWNK